MNWKMEEEISRRAFLKSSGAGAGLITLFASSITSGNAEEIIEPVSEKQKAMLIDVRKCIGCKACQVACKEWNELPPEKTKLTEAEYTNPPKFSAISWDIVTFKEIGSYDTKVEGTGGLKWRAVSLRCMHCIEPQCVSACPTQALIKRRDGPVIYDANRCVGCEYCVMACPWHVPHLNEDSKVIGKCTMCADRIEAGMEPSCVAACPTGSLQFGDRNMILEKAHNSDAPYLYGEKEAGGTSMICISDVPFEEFSLPKVSSEPPSTFNLNMLKPILGVGAVLGVISFIGFFARERLSKLYTKKAPEVTGREKRRRRKK
ncbi:4Fe-4S dicluster domain-containing protein [[Eubacterium] cellulosolvens]